MKLIRGKFDWILRVSALFESISEESAIVDGPFIGFIAGALRSALDGEFGG